MIEVGRSSIVVRNVDLKSDAFRKINAYFSVYDQVTFKYTMSAFNIINNDLYFPASISSGVIKRYFPDKELVFNGKTTKSAPIQFNLKNQPRNEIQKAAVKFLMGLQRDQTNRMRFLALATGTGKTYVTINFISQLKRKAMIIVDTLDLADQWKREFLKHTDIKEENIILLSGAESVEKAMEDRDGSIYIAMHRTLGSLLEKDTNSINKLMNRLKIGIRVFDEAHTSFKNVCQINALSNVAYTVFLTATPDRSKFTDSRLYSKVFQNVPYFDGKKIDDTKYHTVILSEMNSKPTLDHRIWVKTKYGFNVSRWADYIENNGWEFFCDHLNDIFDKLSLKERNKKIVIMLPTLSLIDKTKLFLEEKFPDTEIGTFIGSIKKAEDRLIELSKDIILTNDKIFDKAIDLPDLEILINYVQLSSQVKVEQIMGRLRNRPGKISMLIDVHDSGFPDCVTWFKKRRRFYRKKAKKIIEIEKN